MFEKGHPLYLHPRDCHAPRARRQPRLPIHLVSQLNAAELKKILRDGNYRQRTLSSQDRREIERVLLSKIEPLHAVFLNRSEKLLWTHLLRECVSLVGTEWRVGMPFRVEALPRAWKAFLQKKPTLQAEDIIRFFELLLEVGLITPLGIPGMNGLQTCRFSTDPNKIVVELVPGSQRTPAQVSPEWYSLSRDILQVPHHHWIYGRQKNLLKYLRERFSLRESPQTILKRLGPISRKASGCLGLVVQYANGNLIPCWPGLTAMRPQVAPLLSCSCNLRGLHGGCFVFTEGLIFYIMLGICSNQALLFNVPTIRFLFDTLRLLSVPRISMNNLFKDLHGVLFMQRLF